MDPREARQAGEKVSFTNHLEEAVREAHLVVEAITEVLEIKQELFAELEQRCSRECIFASNTSTLLPTPLSAKLVHKDRLLVAHFWNPAYLAPLVEALGDRPE